MTEPDSSDSPTDEEAVALETQEDAVAGASEALDTHEETDSTTTESATAPADDSDGVDWAAWQAELRSAVSSPADDESWTDDLDESDEWSVTESASLDGQSEPPPGEEAPEDGRGAEAASEPRRFHRARA